MTGAVIGVIFDATALVQYARLSGIAAGELLGEVDQASEAVGLPVMALIAAMNVLRDEIDARQRLIDLEIKARSGVSVLPAGDRNWLELALHVEDGPSTLDGLGLVQTRFEAFDKRVPVATYSPEYYRKQVLSNALILDLSAGWDDHF